MNIAQIEENLKGLIEEYKKEEFIYELLRAYGLPKASITRLKKGSYDLSDNEHTVSWKKRVLYKVETKKDLHANLMKLADQAKNDQRFIMITDFETLLARDVKTKENLDIPIEDLPKHYDFFLPWAGMEKTDHQNENYADIKAAEKMAKLFDEIKKNNTTETEEEVHNLNVFFSRLLFCFFAEDTNIFPDGQFTNGIASHTQEDGSDLDTYLNKLFIPLNTKKSERQNLPAYLDEFPYVNGGLFKDEIESPKFSRRSRQAIIDSGELDWSAINPDIFGSMMQAVITPEHRGGLGMHYTSVPNIMKVIKPLFLDDLYEKLEKGYNKPRKLIQLLDRISQIKVFDPACGSGNFLIIAYKELRRLEIKIIRRLLELKKLAVGFKAKEEQLFIMPESQLDLAQSYEVELFSRIQLTQFYGIELDDFAHEIAQLSLWLAEHQMNVEFYEEFGRMNPPLPLKEAGNIICANACRISWEGVCAKTDKSDIFILGNPPYRGKKEQSKEQKKDIIEVCGEIKRQKILDYISNWFVKASSYVDSSSIKCAFVSTNSITQGEQVGLLWDYIFEQDIEIHIGHTSFMWGNNAKKNAGVAVVVIGIRSNNCKSKKNLFIQSGDQLQRIATDKISPYLTAGTDLTVKKRSTPLSKIPEIMNGSMANDGGHFFKTEKEFNNVPPQQKKFYKKAMGAREFFYNKKRYALWLNESNLPEATQFQEINEIIENVKRKRLSSKRDATRDLAKYSHRFGEVRFKPGNAMIIPGLSAESRDYIPIGFIGSDTIVTNLAQVVYDADPWLFSIISSRINNVWVHTTSGYFKKDVRYSPSLSYNTFPIPKISNNRKQELTQCALRILDERESHSEKTIADLYDPKNMPDELKQAHLDNDLVVDRIYRSTPFESDEQRLEYLFKLYEEMIEAEKETN